LTLLVEIPDSYRAEREYSVDVVLREFLGLDADVRAGARRNVRITNTEDAQGELVVADGLFACRPEDWLAPASLPSRPLAHWNVRESIPEVLSSGPTIPIIYGGERDGGAVLERTPAGIEVGLDLFGSSFFLLTRYEEIVQLDRDSHERFAAESSIAVQENFLERPLVNEYVEVLWALLRRLWPRLQRVERTPRVLVSHDVDWPVCSEPTAQKLMRESLGESLLPRERRALALDRLRRGCGDRCDTFDFLMDESERHGIRSAFYFIASETKAAIDGGYSLDDPRLRRLLRHIHERGHEIGLHPSYNTFQDAERTHSEFERLLGACRAEGIEQESWGGRQHYLRWENPTTWRNWDSAGLAYDSTLTFAERPGFRCGVCFEYPVFDLQARRPLTLRERPLVAMEVSLLVYQRLGQAETTAALAALKETCARFGGDFTLLWHNSRLITRVDRRLYRRAMRPDVLRRPLGMQPERTAS
jgi:hypothetical protein